MLVPPNKKRPLRSTLPIFASILIIGLTVGCEPLGLGRDAGPQMELSPKTVNGRSTVVEGDTVIFRRVDKENAPCHFYDESCDLPPVPVESGEGTIHLEKGYFLAPHMGPGLDGTVRRSGDTVEARIWVNPSSVAAMMPQPFIYEAWIRGLSPDTYQLRVVHERDELRVVHGDHTTDEDYRAVVADTTVEVE